MANKEAGTKRKKREEEKKKTIVINKADFINNYPNHCESGFKIISVCGDYLIVDPELDSQPDIRIFVEFIITSMKVYPGYYRITHLEDLVRIGDL